MGEPSSITTQLAQLLDTVQRINARLVEQQRLLEELRYTMLLDQQQLLLEQLRRQRAYTIAMQLPADDADQVREAAA